MAEFVEVPHHIQLSLNIKGLVDNHSNRRDEKVEWIKKIIKPIKNLGLLHLQETHFKSMTEAARALRKLGGKLIGFAKSPDRGTNY